MAEFRDGNYGAKPNGTEDKTQLSWKVFLFLCWIFCFALFFVGFFNDDDSPLCEITESKEKTTHKKKAKFLSFMTRENSYDFFKT
jgi:hypothetical protein